MGLPVEIKVVMHGFFSGSIIVANAKLDPMGGVVDRGACVGKLTYPQVPSIEEVQAKLRQEYNVREERRRELEFLEKGGEPLEFKLTNAVSLSVQSTSVTDQQPDKLVNSEEKGSIACTTSQHGNCTENSGRSGAHLLPEPNCADNLLLFCGENEVLDGNLLQSSKSSSTPSELSTQLDGLVNAKDKKDSITCGLLRMAYKRRSRPNRDGARTSSTDAVLVRVGHHLSSRHAQRDVKELGPYTEIQKHQTVSMINSTPPSPNSGTICKSSDYPLDLDAKNEAAESMADQLQGFSESVSDDNAFKDLTKDHDNGKSAVIDERGVQIVSEEQDKCLDHSDLECVAHVATTKVEDQANSSQKDGIRGSKEDEKALHVAVRSNKTEVATKLLDSESSCTCMIRNIDDCSDNEMLTNQKKVDSNVDVEKQTLVPEVTSLKKAAELEGKKETQPDDTAILKEDNDLTCKNCQGKGLVSLSDEESNINALHFENEVKSQLAVEGVQAGGDIEREKNSDSRRTGISVSYAETAPLMMNLSNKSSILELPERPPSVKSTAVTVETQESNVIATSKADEDAILKEAHIIQAKRKSVSESNVTTFHVEIRKRSHWNYVLEEMAWLANDFAQERLWKMAAAAQLCHLVADASLFTYQGKQPHKENRKVAHILSKAVMTFWNSVQKANKGMDLACQNDSAFTIWEYAKRFIKCNSSNIPHDQATSPATTDRIGHLRTMDVSQEDNSTEGSLFYQVPFNAMEAYRKVIESHVVQHEKFGNSFLEGETSACDVTDIGLIENGYEEAGEETSIYNYDISKSSKFAQKKRRIMIGYDIEPQNVGDDLMHTQFFENKRGVKQSVLVGKRSASNLNVSVPTKRVRTASRQRVLTPHTAGTFGCVPLPIKAEASNADTSPFQEDLGGGPIMPNSLDVESGGDCRKSFPFDSTEVHVAKRKKKGSAHEQKRQVDSNSYSEQRDQPRKRPEIHPLESNGLSVQHILKKPNSMMPSALDNNFDNIGPVKGSIPSPVTAQMNTLSNSNKLFKILGGGDQSRKAKLSNVPTRQQGSGIPWSLFEDQALIVLVHDIGPNWELVSHTINSTLKFKCIYRSPEECKERRKILMDKTTGDEVDSADELGSTKPYPYTLRGIPKGSARQLFQRLQGPIEEETLKSHFEKIILIAQKFQCGQVQNDNHDHNRIPQPHSSHMLALSQVHPNNLSGGGVLTPLDLCDSITSSPDILSDEFQRSHINGLSMRNPCSVASVLPASGISPALQRPATTSNNYSPSSELVNSSLRDGRCAVSRSASLSIDEQKKMQKYKHIFSARNIQQPTPSGLGNIHETDRGMQVLSRRGTGMMSGGNRSFPVVARPGLHGIAPSMLNSGSTLSSGMVSVQSPVHNMHSGAGLGQVNSVARPRNALHMVQPSRNQETERPIQVSQASNQGVPPYGRMSSSFSSRASSPPVSSYPPHHQLSHPISSLQPHQLGHHPFVQVANHASDSQALRLAKERQLQQRFLQQKHKKQLQMSESNALFPHVQQQAQLPITLPLPNNSQVQSRASSPPIPFSPPLSSSVPSDAHQQKHRMSPHGLVRNSQASGGGLTNQLDKQRRLPQQQPQPEQQHQHLPQAGMKHPHQRQQTQSQHHTKHVKGVDRGNILMQQCTSVASQPNGLSTTLGNTSCERHDQAMHSAQQQSLYSVSALNPTLPQRMLHPGQSAPPFKKVKQMPCHTSQGDDTPELSASHLSVSPFASSRHQQPSQHHELKVQLHPEPVNQNPPTPERVHQPSHHVDSEMTKQCEESQNELNHASNTRQRDHPEIVMPEAVNYSTNGAQVVSPRGDQLSGLELLGDSVKSIRSSNLSSCGTQLACAATEPTESIHQKQSSGGPDPIKHEVNEQSKKSPQLQRLPLASQPHPQGHDNLPSGPATQTAENSIYITPADCRVD